MGKIQPHQPVKLFVGILTSLPGILSEVEKRLVQLLGPVETRSAGFCFDFTHYYDEEMGSPIQRSFLGLSELINAEEIARIKVRTNQIEADLASDWRQVRRPVNLDPGYLELSKIVLASTKNYYHRMYLSGGIFAEVTLHFEDGTWKALPWTFPDFQSRRYDSFFTEMRDGYRALFRGIRGPA